MNEKSPRLKKNRAPYVDTYGFLPDEVMLPAIVRSYWGLRGYRQKVASMVGRLLEFRSPGDVERLLTLTRDQVANFIIENGSSKFVDVNKWLEMHQRLGFGAIVLHCELNGNPDDEPDQQEKHLGHLASVYIGRVVPFGTVSPNDPERAKIYIERAVLRRNFKGMTIRPHRFMRPASDAIWFPLYEVCQQLHIPVWIHTAAHWWPDVPMDINHPMHVDRVATEFPQLKIIMGRAGWPWVTEAVMAAWRHPNVFIDTSGWQPGEMARIGSGFEPLFHYGAMHVAAKVLYGSQWHWTGKTMEELMEQFSKTPVPEGIRENWLGENATRLLDLKFG